MGSDNESIVWIVDMEGSIQVYQEVGETVVDIMLHFSFKISKHLKLSASICIL